MAALTLCSTEATLEQSVSALEELEILFKPGHFGLEGDYHSGSMFNGIDTIQITVTIPKINLKVYELTKFIAEKIYCKYGLLFPSIEGDEESHLSFDVMDDGDVRYVFDLFFTPRMTLPHIHEVMDRLETFFGEHDTEIIAEDSEIGFISGDSIQPDIALSWSAVYDVNLLTVQPPGLDLIIDRLLLGSYINIPEHEKEL